MMTGMIRRALTGRLSSFASLFLVASLIVWIMSLPRPSSLVNIVATSEIVTLAVTNPDAGAFALRNAKNIADGRCHATVFVRPNGGPAAPNEVRYLRLPDGSLTVSVRGRAQWQDAEGAVHESTDLLVFVLSSAATACRSESLIRLTAAGAMQIGAEPTNAVDGDSIQPTLLGGEMAVFGRAIASLGPIPLPRPPFAPGAIYQADTIALLPGSRVGGGRTIDGRMTEWRGYVDADMGDANGALTVRAATNADAIDVYPPAPPPLMDQHPVKVGQPDRISITLAAQLARDPNILWLGAALAALLAMLNFLDRATRSHGRMSD